MRAQIVSFHCALKDKTGKLLSLTFNHDVITDAEGHGELLRGLAEGLENLTKGERRRICLSAEQAFGYYDPRLVIVIPLRELSGTGAPPAPGRSVTRIHEGKPRVFRIIDADGKSVTLDGNHPLAGQDLVFDIEATDARYATSEEIADSRLPERPSRPGQPTLPPRLLH